MHGPTIVVMNKGLQMLHSMTHLHRNVNDAIFLRNVSLMSLPCTSQSSSQFLRNTSVVWTTNLCCAFDDQTKSVFWPVDTHAIVSNVCWGGEGDVKLALLAAAS